MNFFQSAILGIVQGLTEFIPVSSTGHLILARKILGLQIQGTISFDAIIQLTTGAALVCYFWRDILNIFLNPKKTLLWSLIIGTIPAVILGLLLENFMDTVLRGTHVVAVALIIGAVLFYFAEKFTREGSLENISIKKGLMIGLFQCLALVPGFSRSGATISGGLFNKLNREEAARFSFLLSIPIILGSGLKKVFDLYQAPDFSSFESSLVIASLFAFFTGILAIHFLLKFIKNHSLNYFGAYRVLLAIAILIWL